MGPSVVLCVIWRGSAQPGVLLTTLRVAAKIIITAERGVAVSAPTPTVALRRAVERWMWDGVFWGPPRRFQILHHLTNSQIHITESGIMSRLMIIRGVFKCKYPWKETYLIPFSNFWLKFGQPKPNVFVKCLNVSTIICYNGLQLLYSNEQTEVSILNK
jgi:hypothetical protein